MHEIYKTLIVVKDEQGIAGLARWNVENNGDTAYVLDWILRPDYRNKGLGRRMILEGIQRFPTIKNIKFKRETIRPNGKPVIWSTEEILRRNI